MKLVLEPAPGWTFDGDSLVAPGGVARIDVGPLVPLAGFDPRPLFERDAPSVEYLQIVDAAESTVGWPMRLATLRTADGEMRLGAVYAMTPWTGATVARVPTRAQYDALRPALVAMLSSARADLWSDEPVCIAELWEPPR